ncbi:gp6 domain containing protein [uncultured Caudovirales phage]|uniref:Gp6 domain containing protein n=1 Tax=uncultured Caudovirales phage TaxID=2100421 RepID=A0A6J5RJU4_9CAUD|nr:gp6 domain containing protein [uncultured Caudovirales phage]CAB4173780.1 gp6 domain containing protein [uncultured Caudovirales phage]CAB4180152.1 gp6 domain containing protein [uncultured Caudovirales phage]CAB4193988.1 gp6 domain containing protein [uncultured Caudovirales phage]
MAITNGYITLANLKTYLKIDDSVEDTLLESIIESASRSIDRIANRRFYLDSTASARTYRPVGNLRVIVDDFGTTTGLILKTDPDSTGTYQKTMTLNTDYIVEPTTALAKGRPLNYLTIVGSTALSLPVNYRPQVEVTAKWGWPSVPDDIEQATYILSADLYKRKDSIGGVLGLSELGAIRMSPLGRDIAAMVRAYRREFFA